MELTKTQVEKFIALLRTTADSWEYYLRSRYKGAELPNDMRLCMTDLSVRVELRTIADKVDRQL